MALKALFLLLGWAGISLGVGGCASNHDRQPDGVGLGSDGYYDGPQYDSGYAGGGAYYETGAVYGYRGYGGRPYYYGRPGDPRHDWHGDHDGDHDGSHGRGDDYGGRDHDWHGGHDDHGRPGGEHVDPIRPPTPDRPNSESDLKPDKPTYNDIRAGRARTETPNTGNARNPGRR